MTDNQKNAAFDAALPLPFPAQDRVFSGVYYGAYLTKSGKLYALGTAADPDKTLKRKDGMPLIATDVVSAAVGGNSIAYVTRDGHLYVHGGPLASVFAEGPAFTGARAVFTANLDSFLAVGFGGKNYMFGNNKYNIFGIGDQYWFPLDFKAADAPEILEVLRRRKDEIGAAKVSDFFSDVGAYRSWEEELRTCPEAVRLYREYQSHLRLAPRVTYSEEDGSPAGLAAYAGVPNAFVIRPESGLLEGVTLAPENVLSISCPYFEDTAVLDHIDPGAHKKAVYIRDEGRWLFLDGTELYLLDGGKKTVVAKDVADVDLSLFRALILTTSGQIFQSGWRNQGTVAPEGVFHGSVDFPFASLAAFRKRQTGGIFGKLANMAFNTWQEIRWKP